MERLRGSLPSDIYGRLVARVSYPGVRRSYGQRDGPGRYGIQEIQRRDKNVQSRGNNNRRI